ADAVAAPDAPLAGLALLSDEERHQLQVEWNDTAAPALDGRTVYELFAALAARDPEGAALRFDGTTWTRKEILEKSEAVARRLRSQGVGPETRVAVRAERSPETVVEILGVLASGGAYVPIDPEDPEERQRWILDDAGASFALSREAGEGWGGGASVENTAYVIYTSGSTGRPKGVPVTHGSLRNLVEAQVAAFDLRPEDRVLQFASLTFDASVSEIFTALVSGACLVLVPRDQMLPGPDLLARLRGERITAATLPPSALAVLPEEDLPDLRTLVVAGEACPPELAAKWGRGRRFLNAYGPTEATVCATIERDEVPPDSRGLSLGRPIRGATVHLLDRANRVAPRGSVAEIGIGGTGVARGYLNRPDLTAERFVPDPFTAEPGSRLFRTGDLGRQRPDGRIDFLGRADHQLKLRGFRIEPGEVEEVLRAHPEVRDAVAVARPLDGLPVLVAYVVPAGDTIPEPALRDHLRQRLPSHMIPGRFVALDALPLTSRGKVDRRALPVPDVHRPGLVERFTAPRNDVEER
ncbi:MAG TPA: amino acid adenylation domain-containing protein, partial [Thermoanaerobaculia bacterium]|nr:amino acid adenylation domain-containing protein [Thermoanaerobaculia bacterium]